MQSTISTTPALFVSLFPSGRMVVTAPNGRTLPTTMEYQELVDNLPAGDYSAIVETFPDCHQPWPVFVFQNWLGGDCVGEFYPKNFESQTIV